jgi:small multidrug resistance pump
MNPYITLIISLLIGVLGQTSLKYGAMASKASDELQALYFNPYVLAGLAAYFVSAMFYIYSLKSLPLSAAFASVSTSYFLVSLIAHLIYGEPFGLQQIGALSLICLGVYLMFNF